MPVIVKRDQTTESFDAAKISAAVLKCFKSCAEPPAAALATKISSAVAKVLGKKGQATVEQVQDLVEVQLMQLELHEALRQFILYREEHRKLRSNIDPVDAAYVREQKKYFPTELQAFQFADKYSRYNEAKGRRETWPEAVDRVIGFFQKSLEPDSEIDKLSPLLRSEWDMLRDGMLNMEAMPSMRVLQMAGPALERCHSGAYNCAYVAIDHLSKFSELLYVLMQGTGVGFSVEAEFVSDLPKIRRQSGEPKQVHVVEDSTEGWCDALLQGLQGWFRGVDIDFDYSKIRLAGAPLKTKGGRASGPGPLRELLAFTRNRILANQGRRLSTLDVHDIACFCGRIVEVGGVRRAAEISLSDLDDVAMRTAKFGNFYEAEPQRAMANNSAVYDEKPSAVDFMAEFLSLAQSGSGERGIFNRGGLFKQIPKRRARKTFGVNPCQPGWATVLTRDGIRTLDDVGVGSEVWSGRRWTAIVNKVATGDKQVNAYHTTSGIFYGTENHRVVSDGSKIEAKDATRIDLAVGAYGPVSIAPEDVMDGLIVGDGSVHKASGDLVYLCIGKDDGDYFTSEISGLIGRQFDETGWVVNTTITADDLPFTFDRQIPDRFKYATRDRVAGFLRGLFSANGSVIVNASGFSGRVTLKASSLDVICDVQQMLSSLGITSYYTTNKAKPVDFSNGTYDCKESYDLNIGTDRVRFQQVIGFIQAYKNDKLDKICRPNPSRFAHARLATCARVTSVKDIAVEAVYDITVDDPGHTYWTGGLLVSNCGEILLRDSEFCNLSIAIARPDDTEEDLVRKVWLATIIGTLQSTLTNFKYLSPKWKKNCEEERLLGVDINGQMDCKILRPPTTFGDQSMSHHLSRMLLLKRLQQVAIDTNKEWATRLGIPQSAAVTCVKPSGNSSVLFNVSPGLHPRHAAFYVRRATVSAVSPMAQLLKVEGVPYQVSYNNNANLLFEFPVKTPQGAILKGHLSGLEQLFNWADWKKYYTEHNPSVTITVKADEWLAVGNWVYDNWDIVGGLSFLPASDSVYTQAPYEEITEAEYEKRAAVFPLIDYAKLAYYEHDDQTTVAQDFACVGGYCEVA